MPHSQICGTASAATRFLSVRGGLAVIRQGRFSAQEIDMTRLALIAGAAVFALSSATIPASAACNGDASTETVLGAGSGAAVGGLASHSIGGAAIGGIAGGLIGNAIGQSNNREDCRREAYYEDRQAYYDRQADRQAARDYYYDRYADARDYNRGYYVDRYGDRRYYYDDYPN
jgi:hypothetical protein